MDILETLNPAPAPVKRFLLLGLLLARVAAADCGTLDARLAAELQALTAAREWPFNPLRGRLRAGALQTTASGRERWRAAQRQRHDGHIGGLLENHAAEAWRCTFPRATAAGLVEVASTDGRRRLFGWERRENIDWHFSGARWFWRDGQGRLRAMTPDTSVPQIHYSGLPRRLWTVALGRGRRAYLLEEVERFDSPTRAHRLRLLQAIGPELRTPAVFRRGGQTHRELRFSYDTRSSPTRPGFGWDARRRQIHMPVVKRTGRFPSPELGKQVQILGWDGRRGLFIARGERPAAGR